MVGGNRRRRSGWVWWFEFVRGRQNFVEKKTSHAGPRLCARMFGPETQSQGQPWVINGCVALKEKKKSDTQAMDWRERQWS